MNHTLSIMQSRSNETLEGIEAQRIAHRIGLNTEEIRRRLTYVDFGETDGELVRSLSGIVSNNIDMLADAFFAHLKAIDAGAGLFEDAETFSRARQLKTRHLNAMVTGNYGHDYVHERLTMGLLYFNAGLDSRAFLGAFHQIMRIIADLVTHVPEADQLHCFDAFVSLMKIAFFDIGLIMDTLVYERERRIEEQEETLRRLSTAVLKLTDDLLIVPVTGLVDPEHVDYMTSVLLKSMREERASSVVLDVTGVPMIDKVAATALAHMVQSCRLMGVRAVLSGMSANVVRSIVLDGMDISPFESYTTLQGAVEALLYR